jgi:DNA-binding FadR family transcriptional regulator
MFKPIERKSLSRSVFEQLSEQILRGALAPGDNLPGERSLSDVLGVNRGAVREALKRLEQARLVMIQQGGATTVLNYLKTAGLDLLAQIVLTPEGQVDLKAIRSLMELRTALAPDIARRCALRHEQEVVDDLKAALAEFQEAEGAEDRQEANFRLWQALISGSDNLSYQLAFNTLRNAWSSVAEVMNGLMDDELCDLAGHERLINTVIARDGEHAAELARAFVLQSEDKVATILKGHQSEDERYVDIDSLLKEVSHGS